MSPGDGTTIRASSHLGFDDAVRVAIERAHETLEHVSSARVVEHRVVVRDRRVSEYRVLLAVTVDAVISIDDGQKIVEFDRGAESIFGYERDEVIGRSLDMLIPERYRADHERHVRAFGESSTVERMMAEREQVWGLKKDGTEFPVEASIAKRRVEGERRFSVLLRDASER